MRINLFGIPIDNYSMSQAVERVSSAIQSRDQLHVGVVNAAKVVNMHRNPELAQDVLSSDMVLADGASVVWASKLLGSPLTERVAGIDLMLEILEKGNLLGWRVYFLGATEEISEKVERFVKENYPHVVIAGRRNGYFTAEEEESIADSIGESKADVLFVAITSPKKEKFMADWAKIMNVPVVHGVGGSFDVVAGKVKRAPVLWQKLGLEWMYRLLQEPGRLWRRYLVTNSLFCWYLLIAIVKRLLPTSSAQSKES
ncbi:WecB/TagA/CpsF family glycosyltransferase [Aurantivibrio plasticivorans]